MSKKSKSNRVVVIIPTYNGMAWLERCLSSLVETDYEPMTIEVIDNASTDGSADYVENNFDKINVLRLEQNVGFAAAVNLGVHRALEARAETVVLLNQDTRVRSDWLKELIREATSANLSIASPMQLNYEGDALEPEFRRLLEWHGCDTDELDRPYEPVVFTDWVIGAAMMIRSDVFRTIGSLDENYFFYGEELDLCRRALAAGFKVGVVVTSAVCHQERAAPADESAGRSYHRLLGEYIYRLKSPARSMVWLMGVWVRQFVRDLCQGIFHRRRRFLKELFAVQVAIVCKLPAICRRRWQERRCPHLLW